MPVLTPLARKLRGDMTEAEKKLWHYLRREQFHGMKFRRQQVIDRFIVDFVCFERRLAIELDGGQHDSNVADIGRTRIIESKSFLVIRFWNNDILSNIEGVLQTLETYLDLIPSP